MSGVSFRDCWLVDVEMSGYVHHLTVNGVDVTGYVNAELDRRHPERVQLREGRTADDVRAIWGTIDRLWVTAVGRAQQLPVSAWAEQVGGEWSFGQTLRHLIFITDAWFSRTVLDQPMPYHPIGWRWCTRRSRARAGPTWDGNAGDHLLPGIPTSTPR